MTALVKPDYELWPFVIRMFLPSPKLHPNASRPWGKGGKSSIWWARSRAEEIKQYRQAAYVLTRARIGEINGGREWWPWRAATTQVVFFWPSGRNKRDPDNLLAAMKAAFDGIKDGGLITTDRSLTHLPVIQTVDASRSRVEVWMRKGNQ